MLNITLKYLFVDLNDIEQSEIKDNEHKRLNPLVCTNVPTPKLIARISGTADELKTKVESKIKNIATIFITEKPKKFIAERPLPSATKKIARQIFSSMVLFIAMFLTKNVLKIFTQANINKTPTTK